MPRIVTIYCDICGANCTNNHYRLNISKVQIIDGQKIQTAITRYDSEEEIYIYPDYVYVCEHCANIYLNKLLNKLVDSGAEWIQIDEQIWEDE